jgi:hypothetical protein
VGADDGGLPDHCRLGHNRFDFYGAWNYNSGQNV